MKDSRRVYLDTNIYCRPMDNQENLRIYSEAQAFLKLVAATEKGEIEIVKKLEIL
jgi:hypothetical protein